MNPTYMTMTMPTTSSEPSDPNWPRVWIICGTPSFGPLRRVQRHEYRADQIADREPDDAHRKESLNTVTASPPVTMVSSIRFEPNQTVNRSRARPWRCIVRDRLDGADLDSVRLFAGLGHWING